jgi:hypothetical protein
MRFYLTFVLVILVLSGCANSRPLASRTSNAKGGALGAGDALGQSMAQPDQVAPTAITNLDYSDYN